ncbi:MAG: cysteine hydrolase family protein [Bacillota bacterium]
MGKNALLLIDVVNQYLNPEGDLFIGDDSYSLIHNIREQLLLANKSNTPVIYITSEYLLSKNGASISCNNQDYIDQIVSELKPSDDVCLIKKGLSCFDGTHLEYLLGKMKVEKAIITGVRTHSSVLFTAFDAKRRRMDVTVIEDCVASEERMYHTYALALMRNLLDVEIF